jgi:hypothetical protein
MNTTNHDVAFEYTNKPEATHSQAAQTTAHAQARTHSFLNASMQEVVDESIVRKQYLKKKWQEWYIAQAGKGSGSAPGLLGKNEGVRLEELKKWMEEYPVCNEVTHFVCIMEPREGAIRWVKKFEEGEIDYQDE